MNPTHTWERIGRYVCFPRAEAVGAWFGTELLLWKRHGSTPLWLVFEDNKWQRGAEVRAVLEPWASRKGIPAVWGDDEFGVGIKVATGEDETGVIGCVVRQLKEVAMELSKLRRRRR